MLPANYNYVEKEHPQKTCANCYHRVIAYHLGWGTSYCNQHKARTHSSYFHVCETWKETSTKPGWTQDIGTAIKMPDMNDVEKIETFTTEGYCPTCRYSDNSVGFRYCTKYFEELAGTDRTCKECQVYTWGKCDNYEPKENLEKASRTTITESCGISI